ncbi:MAG: FAD-dependent oxidoreductase, partial [SAR202 cluster bacterium]|nr:FAD-dependent oxidoreductase [SAR202 cluster bacterium]
MNLMLCYYPVYQSLTVACRYLQDILVQGGLMDSTADAVVIGGGVTGCAILYNLISRGMKRVVLFDQGSLASGG